MRRTRFADGNFYHIYNRGVDKRDIFLDEADRNRFFQSITEFNTPDPIGSIYEKSFVQNKPVKGSKAIVRLICYCTNPNHFHFLLEQTIEKGIEKFMHRLSTGYTRYFNEKYRRTGALFQGTYKAIHININEYLLRLSAYINLNNQVHKLGGLATKSSWAEYQRGTSGICTKEVILDQFANAQEYVAFAEETLKDILEQKEKTKDMERYLLEEKSLGG